MEIQKSGEDYLETILILKKKKGYVRAIDVAGELNFTKASVSRAMSILKDAGYILIAQDGDISFTESGKKRASEVYGRHLTIKAFFRLLGVSEETAEKDACLIEHAISEESYSKLKEFYEKAMKE